MRRYFNFTFNTFIFLILASCAIQVGPQGGPQDKLPPVVIKEEPANKTVNFNKEKITLYFNEYTRLNNPNQEMIISPLISPFPSSSIRKKTIQIKFEQKLKVNTTYTIQFGKSIADITENNILADYTYIFSTGPKLDSLIIKGKAREVSTNTLKENMKIMLHISANDSNIYKIKPEYYTKTKKDGEFVFNNLHSNIYWIYALDDENGNYLFDKGEQIAFTENPIDLTGNINLLDLNLFKEKEEKLKIVDYGQKEKNKYYLAFNAPVDSLKLTQIKSRNHSALNKNLKIIENRDSVFFWLFQETDSLEIIVDMWGENYSCDTVVIIKENKDLKQKKPSKLTVTTLGNLYTTGKIFLEFNEPVTRFDFSKMMFYIDTNKVMSVPEIKFIDSSYTKMAITYPFDFEKNYKITLLKGTLTGFDSIINDSLVIPIRTMKETELGIISVNINFEFNGTPVITQLLDDKYKVLKENTLLESKKITYNSLLPGKYYVRCILDKNKNSKWDTGNLLKRRQPEQIIYYKEDINLKANWELNDLSIRIQ